MTSSQKVVIPAQSLSSTRSGTGIQTISNPLKTLDSRFHGNDREWTFETFCERVISVRQ